MKNLSKEFKFSGWSIDRWLIGEKFEKISAWQCAEILAQTPEHVKEKLAADPEDISVFVNEDGDKLMSFGPAWTAWLEQGPELCFQKETEEETETEEESEEEAAFMVSFVSATERPRTSRGRGRGRMFGRERR